MQKTIFIILTIILISLPVMAATTSPQIAYRLLDDYVLEKEINAGRSNKIGGGITMGLGVTLMAVAGSLYLWGDNLAMNLSEEQAAGWTPRTRDITCLSLAGGGLVTVGVGAMLFFSTPKDYRADFRYIYTEEDPVVQEALAAGALYEMSEEGRRDRITSGLTDLATPLLIMLITITSNMVQDRPWHENARDSAISLSWNLVSGISKLFFQKSEGEMLYERYLQTKQALLVRS